MVKFSISSHYRGINVHIRETFPVRYRARARARVCPSIVQKFIVNAKNHRALGRFDGSENRCSSRKKGGKKRVGEKGEPSRVSRISGSLDYPSRAATRSSARRGGGGRGRGEWGVLPASFFGGFRADDYSSDARAGSTVTSSRCTFFARGVLCACRLDYKADVARQRWCSHVRFNNASPCVASLMRALRRTSRSVRLARRTPEKNPDPPEVPASASTRIARFRPRQIPVDAERGGFPRGGGIRIIGRRRFTAQR